MRLTVRRKSIYHTLFYILMLSLYFGRFNLDLGFSLKPFMIITIVIVLWSLKYMRFNKLLNFEFCMITFIAFHSLTALNFKYPTSSMRFIILYLIILIYYFSARFILDKLDIQSIEKIISKTGIIAMVSSLVYYLMGIITSGMNYIGNNLDYYGLMIDRSTPRLTGTASNDPNIFVLYYTVLLLHIIKFGD